jgi:hypothetical protein
MPGPEAPGSGQRLSIQRGIDASGCSLPPTVLTRNNSTAWRTYCQAMLP